MGASLLHELDLGGRQNQILPGIGRLDLGRQVPQLMDDLGITAPVQRSGVHLLPAVYPGASFCLGNGVLDLQRLQLEFNRQLPQIHILRHGQAATGRASPEQFGALLLCSPLQAELHQDKPAGETRQIDRLPAEYKNCLHDRRQGGERRLQGIPRRLGVAEAQDCA